MQLRKSDISLDNDRYRIPAATLGELSALASK